MASTKTQILPRAFGDGVTVRVPATTANLGPGFDTLGVALRLYNFVRVKRSEARGVNLVSPIADSDRAGAIRMLSEAAQLFFQYSGKRMFGIEVALSGEVPIARGLGSSVTARLGVITALDALTKTKLAKQQLLEMVTELEHHPDNAAPAIFGGFAAAGILGSEVRCLHFPVSRSLKFVALIPRFEVSTEKARKLVPKNFSKADTVHNLNHSALISAAFAAGDYEALRGLFEDRVHQPYREKLIPQLSRVIRAGEKAGAIGGWLSGSGSTIMCITLRNEQRIARAMQNELPESDMKILTAASQGATVVTK